MIFIRASRLKMKFFRAVYKKIYADRRYRIFISPEDPKIEIYYKNNLEGGGTTFGMDFFRILDLVGVLPQGNIMEWCSGPGFIGFSLYGKFRQQITSLELVDINPDAVKCCQRTIRLNNITNCIATTSDSVLRKSENESYLSLIVSNPPHFSERISFYENYPNDIRVYDLKWAAHKKFFEEIVSRMTNDSIIILQENNRGSTCSEFSHLIRELFLNYSEELPVLEISNVIDCKGYRTPNDHFYYLVLRLASSNKVITKLP